MTAQIIQFVPKPNPDREKHLADLQGQASNRMHEMLFGAPVYASSDLIAQTFHAPEKDPA